MNYPPPYLVDPEGGHQHTHTAILLHGRGSTAQEFANDIFTLRTSTGDNLRARFPTWRWVFPDSGYTWCTAFNENRSAWFDTWSLDNLRERQDLSVTGLRNGALRVKSIIIEEVERLNGKSDKVILGGFSQGSAVALWSLFTGAALTKGTLGAFVGLSAWMPLLKEAEEAVGIGDGARSQVDRMNAQKLMSTFTEVIGIEPSTSNEVILECFRWTPVYFGHGSDDALIDVSNCDSLCTIFRYLGADVDVAKYVGAARQGHWVKEPEQMDDIAAFFSRVGGRVGTVMPFVC